MPSLGTLVLLRFVLARLLPDHHYLRFVTLTSFVFLWIVLWFYWEGLNTVPESRRYALEMEMFLWLAIFEWLRLVMRSAPSSQAQRELSSRSGQAG